MKIELIPTRCVPVGKEEIERWIETMAKDEVWDNTQSGDALVRRSVVEGQFDVYRRTQTYRVEKGTDNEA